MTGTAIELKNVSKAFRIYHERRDTIFETITGWFNKRKYENLEVLKDVSFTVERGEMFGIVGKNGTGKTTLLRIIANIYKPDSGTVKVNGSLIPFLSLGVGFHPDLTARTNLIQYGILLGFKKKEIISRANSIIEFAELQKFEDTKLKNFSTGMLARLAFSTAIQVDPDIIIIDEVLSVGDLSFQKKSYDTILSFKKKGKTIIFVSHDMTSIREHCDRAMFLNEGKVQSIGDPEKVIKDYTNASFPV